MKFSDYVALREEERSITISSLLQEIAILEKKLTIMALAYNGLKNGKHHKAGFIAEEE